MTGSVDIADVRRLIEDFVAAYPTRANTNHWWRRPLTASAAADARFAALPRMAAPDHWLPADLLPSAKTVVVFFLPFVESLVTENARGDMATGDWAQAYTDTNIMIGRIGEEVCRLFEGRGYAAVATPATKNFDPEKLRARWSHKHLAFLSGLGRFGHNTQMITPAGCCGRLGSLVTAADLGDHRLVGETEACLHRAGEECLACAARCPVEALTAAGLDRQRCWTRLLVNGKRHPLLDHAHVCGKCVAMLPCSFENPVARAESAGQPVG